MLTNISPKLQKITRKFIETGQFQNHQKAPVNSEFSGDVDFYITSTVFKAYQQDNGPADLNPETGVVQTSDDSLGDYTIRFGESPSIKNAEEFSIETEIFGQDFIFAGTSSLKGVAVVAASKNEAGEFEAQYAVQTDRLYPELGHISGPEDIIGDMG